MNIALTAKRLRTDMEALGFEEVPVSAMSRVLGNRDFQREATLIRFWGWSDTCEWVRVTYQPDSESELYESISHIGRGLAALCVFLAKGGQ